MEAKDLRFGNLVLVDNEKYHPKLKDVPMIVRTISRNWSWDEAIKKYSYKYYCEIDKRTPEKYDFENYSQLIRSLKPIELNKDWLEKYGWEEINKDLFDNVSLNVAFEKTGKGFKIHNNSKTIKYVHELQNYMFFAKDVELKI